MVGKALAAVIVIAFLVPAVALMLGSGPTLVGWGIYEAVAGKTIDAAGLVLLGIAAGAFGYWLTPGFLGAVTPAEGEHWLW